MFRSGPSFSHSSVYSGEESLCVAGKATLLCVKGGYAFLISRDQVGCSAWQLLGAHRKGLRFSVDGVLVYGTAVTLERLAPPRPVTSSREDPQHFTSFL